MTAHEGIAGCILVVEDDRVLRELLEELLEEEGAEVTACATPEEVMPCLERVRPDLLVVDLSMKREGDGWDLIERLQTNAQTQTLPILICTGLSADRIGDERQHWVRQRGIEILTKPFELDVLFAVVHRLIQSSRHAPSVVAE